MKREFTGVFIPAHIWTSSLLPAEKMLLGEVASLSVRTGWCDASREHFASWLHCDPTNVSHFVKKLEKAGYLEVLRTPGERNKMRVNPAAYWPGVVNKNAGGVVNPIHGGSEPRSRVVVNPVHGGSEPRSPEIQVEIQAEREFETREANTHAPEVEFSTLEEKENPSFPHVPPAPLSPAAWSPVNPDAEIEKMRTDFTCIERFAKDSRTTTNPEREFAVALEDFALVVKSEKKTYAKASDLRGHFFNWLPFRQKRKEMFGASDTATTTSMRKAKPGESAPLHW